MYKTPAESEEAARRLAELTRGLTGADVLVAPAHTALVLVSRALAGSDVLLGAQNLHWEKEGAFTGEISAQMLVGSGCSHVIIGHSERRQYFGETDETVRRRVEAALEAGLVPIVCVGETLEERKSGDTLKVLDKQISGGLKKIFLKDGHSLVVAYEPVWAIGTGLTATPQEAQEAHAHIRKRLAGLYGETTAAAIRILYGGSVKPENIRELMARPDIDGALVGGASLAPETFARIARFGETESGLST